jgi:hypothetical protein
LSLIAGIAGHPLCWRTTDIVTARQQRLVQRLAGSVGGQCSRGSGKSSFQVAVGRNVSLYFLGMGLIKAQSALDLRLA